MNPSHPVSQTLATAEELERLLVVVQSSADVRLRYKIMRKLFRMLLAALTADAPFAFSGPYAQVIYVAQHQANGSLVRLNGLRIMLKNMNKLSDAKLSEAYESNFETLRFMLSLLHKSEPQKVTREAVEAMPSHERSVEKRQVRVSISDFSNMAKVAVVIADENTQSMFDLSDFQYLNYIFSVGTQLNLIDSADGEDGILVPRIVVFEPDFLVDISSIASCFTPYADAHELFLINKLRPRQTTPQILLGNMAGLFLDKCLHCMRSNASLSIDYNASAREFFRSNALSLAITPGIDRNWHAEGQRQLKNVRDALVALRKMGLFDAEKSMTEPSFISEALGIQGRMDLLQSDYRLLVEQKSGKMNEFGHQIPVHREEHYVQVVLYQLLLSVNFGIDTNQASQFLFYSKYEPSIGLVREGMMPRELISRIFELRNMIVFSELRYTKNGELEIGLMTWQAADFRRKKVSDNLWKPYIEPQINEVLRPIQTANDLARDYYFAMLSFLQRESVLSRLGSGQRDDRGFSNLWNLPAEARKNAGEMLDGLTIKASFSSTGDDNPDSVDIVVLQRNAADDSTPNFRHGDIVILYDYAAGDEPNALASVENRATIVNRSDFDENAIDEPDCITVKLRSFQSRKILDEKGRGRLWAIDHDMLDSQNTNLMKQLSVFMRAPARRQQLILGTRKPELATSERQRQGDYGDMNPLVDQWLATDEMFLLVGPPGTGKTSRGLVSIMREELLADGHCVLLLSYTNRAVDEICSKLEALQTDYIRIGSRFSCAKEYRHRLLAQMDFANTVAIRRRVEDARVFVGTTAAFCANFELFGVKHFHLAIVDEASQILEPNIVGLLSACSTSEPERLSIDRFVLIGDHKQLPAVVAQRPEESETDRERLRAICLTDCRRSFFERMIELLTRDDASSPFVYRLTNQGRMHPETADFCNRMFYSGSLRPIPLGHPKGDLHLAVDDTSDSLTQLLARKRLLYFDSFRENDGDASAADVLDEKVNRHEARLVADIVRAVYRLRARNGQVSPQTTVGVVVPYRHQIMAIRNLLISDNEASEVERNFMHEVTIDTVERFQGSERDVVIYGFTVKNSFQLKFLTDSQFVDTDGHLIDRKLNVAMSRAREQLIVVGNSHIIGQVPLFSSLIDFIHHKG